MKKIHLVILAAFLALVPALVRAEVIQDFTVEIRINGDGSLHIREDIAYDFEAVDRHGIYRDIPYKYETKDGRLTIRITDITVADEKGRALPFTSRRQGGYLKLKIGDPDKYVTGLCRYIISYRVEGATSFFPEYDEVYWNVTGHEWTAPILQAKAVFTLPASVAQNDLHSACYAGRFGSTRPCLSTRYEYAAGGRVSEAVFINDRLPGGEGLTVAVGFPKGLIRELSPSEKFFNRILDNGIAALPLAVFLALIYLWQARGRDPAGRGTIIAQFDPPDGLTPAVVGTIIDERAHKRDISAELIHLAAGGYLKIRRLEKTGLLGAVDYELEKTKDESDLAVPHERKLIAALFKEGSGQVRLSELKDKFYRDLENVKQSVYEAAVSGGYFPRNPTTVRAAYAVIGVAVMVAGWVTSGYFGAVGIASFATAGAMIMAFSFIMPKKTAKGVSAREHILGLKRYLRVAEKDRLEFHNAPEKNPERFERLLPYAMVLGVEKEWAKQFEGIYRGSPDWYAGGGGSWSAAALASSLDDFSGRANAVLSSSPSSGGGAGGGGFSGGGAGGGGGGSW